VKIAEFVKKLTTPTLAQSFETKINLGLLMWLASPALNIYESGQNFQKTLTALDQKPSRLTCRNSTFNGYPSVTQL